MVINGFTFGRLDLLRKNLRDLTLGIPISYGIYQWVYWPEFDEKTISKADLIDLIKFYSQQNFYIEEEFRGVFKFNAKIWEQGYRENANMFGLNDKGHGELDSFFDDRTNIAFFSNFFKEICFIKPFYVGKANNLQDRLSQHFAGTTNVIPAISLKKIPERNIWVGYKEIQKLGPGSKINTVFEEIYSRKVKPGLSIKPN